VANVAVKMRNRKGKTGKKDTGNWKMLDKRMLDIGGG
jgi:hypothetical protein